MAENILDVRGLTVEAVDARGRAIPILQEVGFQVGRGEVLALIGESGSGKTTASLAMLGYAKAGCRIVSGSILLDGVSIRDLDDEARRRMRGVKVSYIAQSAAATFNSAIRIGRQVTEIPVIRGLMSQDEANARAVELYRQLSLPNPETIGNLYPHQVSGGQLQRLMAAMAMLCEPKLLILDEPTTALDVTTQIEVLEAVRSLIRDRGTSAIYVSHDLSVVAQVADSILVLKDGRMVESGSTEQIISAPRETYTKSLIAAVKTLGEAPFASGPSSTPSPTPLLEVDGVSAAYGRGRGLVVLRDVTIRLARGETLGVIGESGSGKSTLGRVISGLMAPILGQVRLEGEVLAGSIARRSNRQAQRIQFAFQMADTALNPRQRVHTILSRPLQLFHGLSGSRAATRIGELLGLVGLPQDMAGRFPHQLSGGQKQRVNLARALAAEPDVIICDEITSGLDTVVAAAVMDLLRDLRSRLGISYIFISHDLSTVADFADSIAVMRLGEVVDAGTTSEVLSPPYHPYTELLVSSVPELRIGWLDEVMERRRSIAARPGTIVSESANPVLSGVGV